MAVGTLALVVAAAAAASMFVLRSGHRNAAPRAATSFVRPFAPDATTVAQCAGVADRRGQQHCRAQAIGNVAFREGSARAFAQLDAQVRTSRSWQGDAHLVSHWIGAATLLRNHGDVGLTMAQGSYTGSAGYYHGVVMGRLAGVPAARMAAVGAAACDVGAVVASTQLRYKCLHGLGHGFMLVTGYDLPRALRACDTLRTGDDQFDCTTGVFMENASMFLGTSSGFPPRYLREADPVYPCNAVAERHQFACYVQLVNVLGPRSGWDWTTVSHQCAAIHPSRFVAACFDSMGLWAFARASGQARGIERICAAGGTAGQSACVAGAARTAINQNPTSVASQRRAGALCASYATHDLALARHCYASAGVVLRTLGGDALRSGCAVVGGSRFASACMQALPDMRQLPAQGGLS